MPKTSVITARVDHELKSHTEKILHELGLTPSQAITLFYNQINLHSGLPFPVNLPNEQTRQALRDARGRKLETFDTVDDLLDDLQS